MSARSATVRELFDAALARPAAERRAWLEQSGHEPALLEDVAELLDFAERGAGPLDTPLLDESHLALAREGLDDEPPPARIGPYEIVRALGRGSMGTVYEALQENPRRTVALKLLHAGLASESALRRFQLEVDALGRLDHPFIASIHEAGSADLGRGPRPYLVMELVQGSPLSLAMRRRSSTRERLELLARLGEGIAHAHSRGVVHRDLKPDNVIVDEQLRPRILDFGVARLLDPEQGGPRATRQGLLVGTLQSMSPEQAAGDASRLDTRSDVYALGVLGYELLTGRPPYELDGLDLPDALRVILEQDGPPAGAVVPELRGDVETILAKAMSKDPEHRYQSAAEFVADVRRHLSDEPILARPASTADQLRRFARKNRALVIGASVGLLLLLAGLAVMAWGLSEARDQNASNLLLLESERAARLDEQRALRRLEAEQAVSLEARRAAERALVDSEELADFTTDILLSVHPEHQGWDVRLSAVLDAAAERARDWEPTPWVRARVDETLGRAYMALGRFDRARPQLERALAAWREIDGVDSSRALAAQSALGATLYEMSAGTAAWELRLDLLERAQRLHGADDPRSFAAELDVARTQHLIGRYEGALASFSSLIERASAALGAEHELVDRARFGLGALHVSSNRFAAARELFVELLEARRENLGEEHLDTLDVLRELAQLDYLAGDLERAMTSNQTLQAAYARVLGPEHPTTLESLADEARIHVEATRYEQALDAYAAAIDGLTRVVGATHGLTLLTRKRHAALLTRLDRVDAAQLALEELIAADDGSGPPADWLLSARRERGFLLMRTGQLGAAREELETTLAAMRVHFGDHHLEVAHMLMDLSNLEMNERRLDAAEAQLVEAEAIYREVHGDDHQNVHAARMNRASGYLVAGRYGEAETLLVEMIKTVAPKLGTEHPMVLRCMVWLADALIHNGRAEQALPMLELALAGLRKLSGPTHELVVRARFAQVDARLAIGELADAEAQLDVLAADLAVGQTGAPEAFDILSRRLKLMIAAGRHAEVEALLIPAIARAEQEWSADSAKPWELRFELARVTALSGRLAEALPLVEAARAQALEQWGAGNWELSCATAALVELNAALGREQDAEGWRDELAAGRPPPPRFLHD